MSRTILLVDHDDVLRRSIALLLKNEGYEVQQAKDPLTAFQLADTCTFDVVITEYRMRGRRIGTDVLQSYPRSGKILYTAYRSKGPKTQAKSMQALHLTKPAGFDEILRAINTVLPKDT